MNKAISGLSLLEMLMTLFIMGVVSVGVGLSVSSPESPLEETLSRWSAQLRHAKHKALYEGHAIRFVMNEKDRQMFYWNKDAWQEYPDTDGLFPLSLPDTMQLRFIDQKDTRETGTRGEILFTPDGRVGAFRLELYETSTGKRGSITQEDVDIFRQRAQ